MTADGERPWSFRGTGMSANKRVNLALRLLAALGTVTLTVLVSMAAYSLAGRLEVEKESDRHSFETAEPE